MAEPPKRPELGPWRPTPVQVILFMAGALLVAPGIAGYLYIKLVRGNVIDQTELMVALAVPVVGFIGGTISYVFSRKKAPSNE